jgi:hypothetical protein
MPTLYETMRTWLDAQRALNQQDPDSYAAHQTVIDYLVERLRRHRSLADLATSYYSDGDWWMYIVQEFAREPDDLCGELIHDAAYLQRLLELRRPGAK